MCYIIASTLNENSLELNVSMQTLDTGAIHLSCALLDCGATDRFIDTVFVSRHKLTTKPLSCPIPIYNVDGSLIEAGAILEVVDMTLCYCDHSEQVIFTVMNLRKQNIILGLNWLHEHNLEVDWKLGEVKMSCCPNHCHTCTNKVNTDRKAHLTEATSIDSCCTGPLPTPDIDLSDIPDLTIDPDDEADEESSSLSKETLKDND
jgi:hypothetical protein